MSVVEVGSEKVAVFGGKESSDRIIGHVGTPSSMLLLRILLVGTTELAFLIKAWY
jgi:hypothetical protein